MNHAVPRVSDRAVNHITGPAADGHDGMVVALARDCRDHRARIAKLEAALREKADKWDIAELSAGATEYAVGRRQAFERCADELRALLQEGDRA